MYVYVNILFFLKKWRSGEKKIDLLYLVHNLEQNNNLKKNKRKIEEVANISSVDTCIIVLMRGRRLKSPVFFKNERRRSNQPK